MMKHEIPKTMKALVLRSPSSFGIEEVPVPVPGDNEVLCRIKSVAICGTDPEVIRGHLKGIWPPSYPFIPGHEWAGEVVALGKGVKNFAVGDRVAGEAWKGCGYCESCVEGFYNLCENYGDDESGMRHYGFMNQGSYAEYNAYSIKSIHKMPENVSYDEGALVDTAGVAAHGIEMTGITPGGTVVVIGPGPIGLMAMKIARIKGASKIIAVGRTGRLAFAGREAADEVIDFEKEDPVEAVRRITGGKGANEVFEASGAEGTLHQAIKMLKPGGKTALLGLPGDALLEKVPFKYICRNEIKIYGVKANPNVSPFILSWMGMEKLVVKDLITHVFPLKDIETALETFEKRLGGAVKVVINP